MQRFAALVATGLFVVSCSPEGEVVVREEFGSN
jgi:hypothetical protein